MTTDAYAEALSIAAGEGLIDLQALRIQCLAKNMEGGGEIAFTLTANLNGQAVSQECRRDSAELLVIVQRAIDFGAGAIVTATYSDFSCLR
ncbi:hypothetical protein ACXR0O_19125 [Verrucomicrobiota bacterium sgz303538]